MFGLTCQRLHRRHWLCTVVTDAPGLFTYTLCQNEKDALAFGSMTDALAFATVRGVKEKFEIWPLEMEKAGSAQPPPA